MTNSSNIRVFNSALVMALVFAMCTVAFRAQAADLDMGYSYDYYVPDSLGSSYDYYVPSPVGSSYDYYVPNEIYEEVEYGGFYGGSGWYVPSYGISGSWYMPGFGSVPTGYSNTNVNSNTNSCTNGSCNTNINAPTTINSPTTVTTSGGGSYSYPVYTPVYAPVYATSYVPPVYVPTAPICYTCGCQGYPACYRPPIQPYVTLSAIPYTGLELGPVGTALYWGFLVLWCLFAAYLIAVKKVHSKLARWLIGGPAQNVEGHRISLNEHNLHAPAPAPKATGEFAGIDPFIASQIQRSK